MIYSDGVLHKHSSLHSSALVHEYNIEYFMAIIIIIIKMVICTSFESDL